MGGSRFFAPAYVSRYPLQVMGKQIQVETPLVGRHQLRNVALAIAAAEELGKQGFAVTADSIERGIVRTHWPGRFQVIPATGGWPETDSRCRPQSRRRLVAALNPLGGLRRPPADHGVRRHAGQSHRRNRGNSVSAGGTGDRDPRRQPTLRQPARNPGSRGCALRPRSRMRRKCRRPSIGRGPMPARRDWWW